jgi:hypothetical protein
MGVTQLQPRQAAGFIVLLLAAVSVGFMLMTVLADESDDLLRHTDLLMLLFALHAIAIKFRIINDVYRPRAVSGMESILGYASGAREMCDAEVRHTARVFDGTLVTPLS